MFIRFKPSGRFKPAEVALLAALLAAGLASCRKPALQPSLPRIYSRQATARRDGKPPVIFIPGILGSRLVNRRAGKTVWPDLKADEAALPISSPVLAENRDEIEAVEILEDAKINPFFPRASVYGPLLNSLERYGGYRRGVFITPVGDRDTCYTFAYDWRRDIVESARALGCMIEDLKQRLGRPDLRFDIVAHSMGGLVARYYAMYGERDVLDNPGTPPDWAGARNLGKIVMIGTPNAGSMSALRALLEGYSPTGLKRNTVNPGVVFTIPAVYQMLPPQCYARFFDEALAPLAVELYDVETWRRYGWSAAFDETLRQRELERLVKDLGPAAGSAESLRRAAEREQFLRVVLRRAAAFHYALAARSLPPANLRFYFIGGDCVDTLDGAVILAGVPPRTIFNPSDHPGEKWQRRRIEEAIFSPGDGTVTRHSLMGQPPNAGPVEAIPAATRSTSVGTAFFCETHTNLVVDATALNNLLMTLRVN